MFSQKGGFLTQHTIKMYTEKFTHKSKEYEVRVASDGLSVFIQIFYNGKAANSQRYKVTLETIHDLPSIWDLDVVQNLIETAKSDITKYT